jgi:putative redox protein
MPDDSTRVRLTWTDGLGFDASGAGGHPVVLDADVERGTKPIEALLQSVGACMAIDIVMILTKMRRPPTRLSMEVTGDQMPTPPRFFRRIALAIDLAGPGIQDEHVARAVDLSRDRYCSVVHTLRPDLELDVEWTLGETP